MCHKLIKYKYYIINCNIPDCLKFGKFIGRFYYSPRGVGGSFDETKQFG